MKILLTGATGYIGKSLLPVLLKNKHHVVCMVRDANRFDASAYRAMGSVEVVEADLLNPDSLGNIPADCDAAYYLIHSMSSASGDFEELEQQTAKHFVNRVNETRIRQVIYLSGIVNDQTLSRHLRSRKRVEDLLGAGRFQLTTLRAGIILGSGSASFEIMRDLVEKLPIMVAPKWLATRTQPIAIRNVIQFLSGVLGKEDTFGKSFDIAGPEVLTYKEMLLRFAAVRNLKRTIITVPVMTPKLSSYWLYFVTSTSYPLARHLVQSMSVEVVGEPNDLAEKLDIRLLPYDEAIRRAFDKIQNEAVDASWKDAQSSDVLQKGLARLMQVPTYGCFTDHRTVQVQDPERSLQRIWAIGGDTGWYYANWLWKLRGLLDQLHGGVGLRRGRKNPTKIAAGEALDFWRVLYANRDEKRLLLYAEMKLPGEAWLEFKLIDNTLHQCATFRPLGVWGRLYWLAVWPFHSFIFGGMIRKISE
ncbi:MAG: SDR family oxidoreductase [Cryomorphaceae bacterium]|nr:MAG: SDR family oxidoreductase [Cryomorphaceae bacterium]